MDDDGGGDGGAALGSVKRRTAHSRGDRRAKEANENDRNDSEKGARKFTNTAMG